MDRRDLLLAGLALRVVRMAVRAHRARAIQRDHRRDVFEVVRLHETQKRTHRSAIELKNPERVAAGEQRIGAGVLEREVLEDEIDAAIGLDVLECVVEDCQVAQTQEVHLDQAERLAHRVVELRDDRAVLLALHNRDDVDQRIARQNHAGGMDAGATLEALQALRSLEDFSHVLVGGVQGAELRGVAIARVLGVEDVRQRHALAHDVGRQRLRDLVAHGERIVEDAVGVFDGLLGLDRAEGHDLGDAFVAVLLAHVVDDLAATALVEVDVEVGHGDAVGVEETLEDQAVHERVEIGDPHRVCGDRAGARAAARADPDALLLGPVDEIGDHEKVAGEAHLIDNLNFEVGAFAHVDADASGVAVLEALFDFPGEPGRLGFALGDLEARHVVGVLVEFDVAALGDEQRVVARLLEVVLVFPQRTHLGRRLDVVTGAAEFEPFGIGERRAGAYAQERIVRRVVFGVCVVRVIGRNDRQIEVPPEAHQPVADPVLDVEAVVHQFEEKIVLAEDVLELACRGERILVVADAQPRLDLTRWTAGRADESLGVAVQEFTVSARLVVEAFDARQRRQTEQVVHALGGLGQQRHVGEGTATGHVIVAALVPLHPFALESARIGGEVGLHADDGFDPGRFGFFVEIIGTENVAVIGHGDGRHTQFGRAFKEVRVLRRTIEHRVFRMHMEVHER